MADGNKIPRRVLHTSDFHLETLNDRACHSLQALVGLVVKMKVDLVVIAGDLFDHNRVDNNLVSFVVEQLRRLPVDVVILPGNHDCLVPDSVYHRHELWKDIPNVRIIRDPQGETLDLPGAGIEVWGKPIDSYDGGKIRPLDGVAQPRENGQWHIAVAHGYYVGDNFPVFPSLHISHQEIATSCQDYVALGHYPVFRCVCSEPVKAYYSDSPSLHGAVTIVDFNEETGVQVNRHSLEL